MDPGIDFEFTATFEVFPVVELADMTKVSVIKPQAQISDEDVSAMVQRLREQRATYEPVDRAAAEGDQVKADFAATMDGEPVEGTEGEDVEFVLGNGQMIEDFDKGVTGGEPGATVEFDATFPDDYRAEELQGKTVQFSVTLKEVKETKLPELDEAFYEAFGVGEGGEEAFLAEVRSNMQREMDNAIRNQVKQQVMQDLESLHEFQLPDAAVHREIHTLKDQMLGQFQMGGAGNRPDIDLPDELFKDEAEKRVKLGLVINEVISSQSLQVDQELLDERLQDIASQYGEPEQVVAYYRSNPEQLQGIEMGVLEEQVIDHILNQAQVEALDSSYDEVISGAAIPQPEAEEDDTPETQANAQADTETEAGQDGDKK